MENLDESNPLLPNQETQNFDEKSENKALTNEKSLKNEASEAVSMGWTAEGLPMPMGPTRNTMMMMMRSNWDTGLCACLGRTDEFFSSDLEVCLLGSIAPCVLYGSNAERLGSSPGSFVNHCMPYTGLFLIGNSCFGANCLAPLLSYRNRTALRRKFNLEGSCEEMIKSCGCYGTLLENEAHLEQCESVCDLATHVFCHPCALCQEGREIRRRLPHPGFSAQPVLVMIPPTEQTMGR
ncbi:hypothetical protein Leryth_007558 [Lithospermum erythrorhizon]|nr:hypothetical protein Leryth_007558 [Lithospermum erythrorhizon]